MMLGESIPSFEKHRVLKNLLLRHDCTIEKNLLFIDLSYNLPNCIWSLQKSGLFLWLSIIR